MSFFPGIFNSAEFRPDVNVTARPAAGITGVMALPIHGAWKSLRRKMAGSPQNTLREPRTKLSQQAAKNASSEEKEKILKAFVEAVKGTGARRGKLQKQAQKYLEGDQAALEDSGPSTVLQTPGEGEAEVSADPTPTSPEESSGMRKEERKEKEAERRGYERAMEEMQIEREKDLGSKGF